MNYIGKPIPREEDSRLLQGQGRYTEDINLLNQAYAFVLRSQLAHAEITSLKTSTAKNAPGVLAVLIGDDLKKRSLGRLKPLAPGKRSDGSPSFVSSQPLLAQGRVRYSGEAIGFIVAETPDQAKDAAELVEVEYKELPAITSIDEALSKEADKIWDNNPDNEAYHFEKGDAASTETVFSSAAHVIKHRVHVNRVTGNPMENRGCIAEYDQFEDRYTLRATVQSVHGIRQQIAEQILKIPQTKLRVICDNMGGGFGTRGGCHPEYSMALWASEVTGRPVKWIADRSEGIMTDEQARGGIVDCELALDSNHKFLALRTHTKVPIGAYYGNDRNLRTATGGLGGLAGVYGIPSIHAQVTGGFTNMIGNAQYRGGAKPEPVYVLEVMIDVAARELGVSPIELRRINTLQAQDMPYKTCFGDIYDCGDFIRNFDDCLEASDYSNFKNRFEESRTRSKIRGLGISNSITGVASTNFEHVEIRFDPSGNILLLSGAMDHGQGHATTFKQVLADTLQIDTDEIEYRYGDTDKIAHGVGTFNARCAVFVSGAVINAATKILEKGKLIAAHVLESAAADIEYGGGSFKVAGTDYEISLKEVAQIAFQKPKLPPDIEPGLYEHGEFGMGLGQAPTYPNGVHLAEVEIDPETGKVELVKYTAVDDAGTILNPILFDGQVHGGIVQGASQILMEDIHYDRKSGQLLSGSFMDYCMPRADDFCDFNIAANEIPTARNPLGVKGVGEAGTVGAMPAVMNAINDALARVGASSIEMPAKQEKIWRALNNFDAKT